MFIFAEYYSFRIFLESVNTLEIFWGCEDLYEILRFREIVYIPSAAVEGT